MLINRGFLGLIKALWFIFWDLEVNHWHRFHSQNWSYLILMLESNLWFWKDIVENLQEYKNGDICCWYIIKYIKKSINSYTAICNTILTSNNPETFWKHCGKRRKCCWLAFSPFLSYQREESALKFLSANAFNLVRTKNVLFGKGLIEIRL